MNEKTPSMVEDVNKALAEIEPLKVLRLTDVPLMTKDEIKKAKEIGVKHGLWMSYLPEKKEILYIPWEIMKDPSHEFWHPENHYKTVIGVDAAIGKDMSSVVLYEKDSQQVLHNWSYSKDKEINNANR